MFFTNFSGAGPVWLNTTLNPWSLITEASFVVQAVMVFLVIMSLTCWFIVGAKLVEFRAARSANKRFLAYFNSEGDSAWDVDRLQAIYASLTSFKHAPSAELFRAGYTELAHILQTDDGQGKDENIGRAIDRGGAAVMMKLESSLPVLATTAAVAPFIGLFGTVWGIMDSFIAIHGQKDASLDVVAPGIAEALFATAIGLVAAIPAVMAYNYFIRRLRLMELELDAFGKDFFNVVCRHFLRS